MRDKKRHLIEVHVAGICYRETESDIDVLLGKRRDELELYPGKWECGAGDVRAGENFEEALLRQIFEEFGIIVKKAVAFHTYEVRNPRLPQKKIPGVMFVCLWKRYHRNNYPKIRKKEYSEFRWQSINRLGEIDLIPGLAKDIRIGWEVLSLINKIKDVNNQEQFKPSIY